MDYLVLAVTLMDQLLLAMVLMDYLVLAIKALFISLWTILNAWGHDLSLPIR